MTDFVGYQPALPFVNAVDSLFNNRYFRPLFSRDSDGDNGEATAIDVQDHPDEYILQANLPGLEAGDVNIEGESGAVAIRGEMDSDKEQPRDGFLVREWSLGRSYRKLRLPTPLEAKKAKVETENGVLMLTLPKAETAKPKLVPIKAK